MPPPKNVDFNAKGTEVALLYTIKIGLSTLVFGVFGWRSRHGRPVTHQLQFHEDGSCLLPKSKVFMI